MYQITKKDKEVLSKEEMDKITFFHCYKINSGLGDGICALYLTEECNKDLYQKLNEVKPFSEREKITYYSPLS